MQKQRREQEKQELKTNMDRSFFGASVGRATSYQFTAHFSEPVLPGGET